jgi:hypothetical protein
VVVGKIFRFCEHFSATVAREIESTYEVTWVEANDAINPTECVEEDELSVSRV